ncbi:MAG: hypothetical protein GIKADHBN_00366 [Phycisphaerales bacterium]|nr:hypothetical protein [Phycisphaerales bacterium]
MKAWTVPLPRMILVGHGSWRAKLNRNEPRPPVVRPSRPRWLDRDAKRMWNKVVEHIVACELAANIDAPLVARYCQAWSSWKRAEEFLHAHGETYTVRSLISGQPVMMQWPQAAHALRLASELSRLERVLGIGPFMRRRVPVNARPGTPHAHPTAFERKYCRGGVDATRKRFERRARRERLKQMKLAEAAAAWRKGT